MKKQNDGVAFVFICLGYSILFPVCLYWVGTMLSGKEPEVIVAAKQLKTEVVEEPAEKETKTISLERVCYIAFLLESASLDPPIGKHGEVGPFQITEIMVDDCNRIMGFDYFTVHDRKDLDKSRLMFLTYSTYYANKLNDWTVAGILRRWNGGPDGHLEVATLDYWNKAKQYL